MGAFFLTELDAALASLGLFYVRYMDDILVLAPTRWTLRAAVKVVNQIFASCAWPSTPTKPLSGGSPKALTSSAIIFAPAA
jgi:RNA-directed DNA polymerase